MAVDLGELFVRLGADLTQLSSGLQKAEAAINRYVTKTDKFLQENARHFQRLGRQAQLAGLAITGALTVSAKKYGDFDKAMRRATAVSEVTGEQFTIMAEQAEAQSIALNTAATQTAEAFYFLGSAGLKATQQLEAFIPTTTLAKAAVIDMGQAAEILVDTMKGFHISFKQTTRVTDILSRTVTSSNTTFGQLGEALSYVAGIARNTNNTLEETSAILATFADVGIKGTRAGTSLRMALTRLSAPTGETKRTLDQLGISISDTEGRIRPLLDIVADLEIAFKGLTEVQRNHALKALFGQRAIAAMISVFDRGSDSVRRFAEELADSSGATEELTERQMAAFSEKWGAISREIAKFIRTVGSLLVPALEDLGKTISQTTKALSDWMAVFPETSQTIVEFTAVLGLALIAMGTLMTFLAKAAFVAIALKTTIGAVIGTFALAATAIGLTVYNVIQLIKSFERVANTIEDHIEQMQRVKKLFKEATVAIEEYRAAADQLGRDPAQARAMEVFGNALEKARENLRNFEKQLSDFDRWGMENLRRVPYFRELDTIMQRLQTSVDQAEKSYENALGRMKTTTAELTEEIAKTADEAIPKVESSVNGLQQLFLRTAGDIENAFEDAFVNITTDAENWRDHLTGMINDIYRSLTRQMFRMTIAQPLMSAIGGLLGIPGMPTQHAGGVPTEPAESAGGFARGGMVRPVYAARGFRPRGSDTVPAMLTPGELVVPKSIVDLMRQTEDAEGDGIGGGERERGLTMIVQAIDSQDTFKFLRKNRRMIASMIDRSRAENHPSRRGERE